MKRIFPTDTRGVSEVVGAVLLLGILVLLLSIYQISVVPNQNAATEFSHNQQAEDEMVDVRNAILEARSSGKDTFASVTLGTRYQDRTLAVNPPPPTGTLQTVEQPNINVTEEDGDMRPDPLGLADRPLENQFVEYSPRYYEYDQAGTMRYENTIAYHDYGDAKVYLTNQTLLRGETVSLIPLEGTFRKDGSQRVAIEPKPGVLETVAVDDPNVTVPTELSEEEWEDLLENELGAGETANVSNGNLTLSLDGTYDIAYAPVGVNRVPKEGQRSSDSVDINPAAPGDVQLIGAEWKNSEDIVELTFRNSADNNTFTDGRINFYTGSGGTPTQVDFVNATDGTDNPRGTDWVIGGDFKDLDPNVELEGDGATTSVNIVFNNGISENNDFFIISFSLGSGQQATYFVGGSFNFDNSVSESFTVTSTKASGTGSTKSIVEFSVENTDSSTAVIEGISVDSTTTNADRVQLNSGNEFERTDGSAPGELDQTITIDGTRVNLDTDVTLTAGEVGDFTLGQFINSAGDEFDMNGEDVTITFYLNNGNKEQLTLVGI